MVRRHCFRTLREKWSSFFLSALKFLVIAPAFCMGQQTALDLDGRSVDPLRANVGQLVVLVFVRGDCPVSARYAPTIQRIGEEHRKDARFYLVFPDKSESPAEIRKYLHDYRYSIPGLRDPEHTLVKQAHAEITPEAAVFDSKRALIYHGRIDNLYEAFGRARPAPTTHELEDAIKAALAGRAPSTKEVAGVGCYIADVQ
jgi:thiol-disulfide isomerase/thioredoxin